MAEKKEMTEKNMQNACLILGILKYMQEFSWAEILRKSHLNAAQADPALKFLRKEMLVIPRIVPGKKDGLSVRYGISRRGMVFLMDKIFFNGTDKKSVFTISEKEMGSAMNFIKNHVCGLKKDPRTGDKKTGAIGGAISYNFTPTSIGMAITVNCACGKTENITDYDNW